MITYPFLEKKATIGVTAPSSGVEPELHDLVKLSCSRLEGQGFRVICGDTVWTQDKAKSSPAMKRAQEFNGMMQDEAIDLIIPPWGGELLIEILDGIDFDYFNRQVGFGLLGHKFIIARHYLKDRYSNCSWY